MVRASDYFFVSGKPAVLGSPDINDYVKVSGDLASDTNRDKYFEISGQGLRVARPPAVEAFTFFGASGLDGQGETWEVWVDNIEIDGKFLVDNFEDGEVSDWSIIEGGNSTSFEASTTYAKSGTYSGKYTFLNKDTGYHGIAYKDDIYFFKPNEIKYNVYYESGQNDDCQVGVSNRGVEDLGRLLVLNLQRETTGNMHIQGAGSLNIDTGLSPQTNEWLTMRFFNLNWIDGKGEYELLDSNGNVLSSGPLTGWDPYDESFPNGKVTQVLWHQYGGDATATWESEEQGIETTSHELIWETDAGDETGIVIESQEAKWLVTYGGSSLNVTNISTGEIVYQIEDEHFTGGCSKGDNTFVIQEGNDLVKYRYDLTEIWRYTDYSGDHGGKTGVIYDSSNDQYIAPWVNIGSGGDDGELHAIADSDGSPNWKTLIHADFRIFPIITNYGVVTPGPEELRSLSLSDGSEQWSFSETVVDSNPAYPMSTDGERVFWHFDDFNDSINRYYAIDASNGNKLWRFDDTGDDFQGLNPVGYDSVNDQVYFLSVDVSLRAFDPSTGNEKWNLSQIEASTGASIDKDGNIWTGGADPSSSNDSKGYMYKVDSEGNVLGAIDIYPGDGHRGAPIVTEHGLITFNQDSARVSRVDDFPSEESIDDFERGDLSPYAQPGVGFKTDTSFRINGKYSLLCPGAEGDSAISSMPGDGLNYYPDINNYVKLSCYMKHGLGQPGFGYALQNSITSEGNAEGYGVSLAGNNQVRLRRYDGGSETDLIDLTTDTIDGNNWVDVEVVYEEGKHTINVYSVDQPSGVRENKIGSESTEDTTYTGHTGVWFFNEAGGSTGDDGWVDNYRLFKNGTQFI